MFTQQLAHFLVGCLGEVAVPLSDSGEELRRAGADNLVGDIRKLAAGLWGTHRDRYYDARGVVRAYGFDGGLHARAGCQPIVDQQDDSIAQLDGASSVAVRTLAPLELSLLGPSDCVDGLLRQPVCGDDVLVQNADTARSDRAHCQLAVVGHSEFPDEKHVQGSVERASHLMRHWNAATRQRENDHVIATLETLQSRSQDSTCVSAIIVWLMCFEFRDHGLLPSRVSTEGRCKQGASDPKTMAFLIQTSGGPDLSSIIAAACSSSSAFATSA
jgi:hypothetical protein